MGRSSYRHVILSAVAVYTFLALGTDIFDQKEPKKDVFKLEKLVSVLCDFLFYFIKPYSFLLSCGSLRVL